MLDLIMNNIGVILLLIGGLAFVVTVITEVTKNISILKNIPTDLHVVLLSVLLSVLTYFVYVSYGDTKIIWYYIVASVILGFLVAYIAMFGWSKFDELWKRFNREGK
ncbi:MAG: hypothetical protein AB9856_14520 [Cellulosilyticaceae bacterium]